jgi:Alpha amylase, catalytic domain
MTPWPRDPVVHEVFTWVWLEELGRSLGREVTLADVPADEWDRIARPGFDAVWLMGVWERSPMGAAIARTNASMRAAHEEVLADLTDDDVVGSAYCVRDYRVDDHLGGDEGLRVARQELARRGVRLVLDLVPNHVSPDHRWVTEHPEYFVLGTADDAERDPASFIAIGAHVFACGRDPYFPAWPEVLQLDATNPALRAAMAELVADLTGRCDGLRCDMAMLLLDDVFRRTWGDRVGHEPVDGDTGFWPQVIDAVRRVHADFRMWAEAYWDLEPRLLEQGFDACYDKRLYDRLVHHAPVHELRAHLAAPVDGQHRTVRFVENHDEPRAAGLLTPDQHMAALTVVLTVPGAALVHEGELDRRRARVPVTLGRRPHEVSDASIADRAHRLLELIADGARTGEWSLGEVRGWPDNRSADRLLTWSWTSPDQRHLVVVNLSDDAADGMVAWPWQGDVGAALVLTDRITGEQFERDGDDVASNGLYVSLAGPGQHVFSVSRV